MAPRINTPTIIEIIIIIFDVPDFLVVVLDVPE
jgi:hypothetical protein